MSYNISIVKIQMVKEGNLFLDDERLANSASVFLAMKKFYAGADRESLVVLCVDTKNRITAMNVASVGILNGSMVHPREVFKPAILANAAAIILVHNHPSGDPAPSPEDRKVTQNILEAGKIMNIALLDHIVIGERNYYSFKDNGLI